MPNYRRIKYEEVEYGPTERTALRPKKLETFDDALPHVGDFGRYQLWLLVALLPYGVAYASLYFSQFFFTLVPREHWCRIEELMTVFTPEQRSKLYAMFHYKATLLICLFCPFFNQLKQLIFIISLTKFFKIILKLKKKIFYNLIG